jgi:hypothetical protein
VSVEEVQYEKPQQCDDIDTEKVSNVTLNLLDEYFKTPQVFEVIPIDTDDDVQVIFSRTDSLQENAIELLPRTESENNKEYIDSLRQATIEVKPKKIKKYTHNPYAWASNLKKNKK